VERDDKAADKAGRAAAQELVFARRATAKGACGRKVASLAAKVAARLRALTDEVARRPARVADPRLALCHTASEGTLPGTAAARCAEDAIRHLADVERAVEPSVPDADDVPSNRHLGCAQAMGIRAEASTGVSVRGEAGRGVVYAQLTKQRCSRVGCSDGVGIG